jgi:hypothetical protein
VPRTAVVAQPLSRTAKVVQGAGTTIDPTLVTNGVVISGVPLEELIVRVTNTFAGAKVITVRKGANPPALSAGQGDMTGSQAQNEVAHYGPLEGARFSQANGDLYVDFEAGTTGTIWAFRVPRA